MKLKGQKIMTYASYCFIYQTYVAGFGFLRLDLQLYSFLFSNMYYQTWSGNKIPSLNSTFVTILVVCTRFNTASRTLSTLGQSTAVEKNRKQNFAQFFKQKVPIDWWNKWLPEGGRRFIASNFAIFFHAEKGILLVIRNWWLT